MPLMTKTKALAGTLVLALLFNLAGLIPALASPDEARWSPVNIPTEGKAGKWLLAGGSDVQHLTMAIDGSLYAYANPAGINHTLFKSSDNGISWSENRVEGAIVAIATAPDDARLVYYATAAAVYRSTDGAGSFLRLPPNPGGAGSNNITITSLDVARLEGNIVVAIGSQDSDNAQYGGVYTLTEKEILPAWVDTNIGNYDVATVAFSPNFALDRQMVAVVTDEKDTIVTARIADGRWGTALADASIKGLLTRTATIAFPGDYEIGSGDYALFVAIDSSNNTGDLYRVNGARPPGKATATDLNIGSAYNLSNVDVSSLAISGNTTAVNLIAGAADDTQVYFSQDNGRNWQRSRKKPTGQYRTAITMSPDFVRSHRAYAATSGNESAFSLTTDGGLTWNQLSLIDTRISQIIDLAVSPAYSEDATLFLLTFDADLIEHSLWRSRDGGENWRRTFTSSLAGADRLKGLQLSPQYGRDSLTAVPPELRQAGQTVFLTGTSSGNPAIWQSKDGGQTFARHNPPFAIDTWLTSNDDTVFFGSYNGSNGLVYRSSNGGMDYSRPVVAGGQPLKSIALSPDYKQDKTLLVGNSIGWVYWSADNGTSFEPLPPRATAAPLSGEISVVFDPEFGRNKTVYAASNEKTTTSSKERLYRFIIGKSDRWESIDSTLPVGSILSQLAVSANGTFYASNSSPVSTAKREGGLERSLNPTFSLIPGFETVSNGLEDGVTLSGLWLCGNQLWSIDSKNTRLMTYLDSLALPVILTSPDDKAGGTDTRNIQLDWQALKGATQYQWQANTSTDFSTVPDGFDNYAEASSIRLPPLEPGTTYYWRVRATRPVLSPWSAKWSFTTILSTPVIAPELYSPKAGASNVPLKTVFQWSALAGADSYELLVATDASLANPLVARVGDTALPDTAWQRALPLDYETTYYWKVRARGSASYSAWSAVSAFTTESPPKPAPPLEVSPPAAPVIYPPPQYLVPVPPSAPAPAAIPVWVIYAGVALLLTTVILLATILVVLLVGRRATQ